MDSYLVFGKQGSRGRDGRREPNRSAIARAFVAAAMVAAASETFAARIAWSPDGKVIVSVTHDAGVVLWKAASGDQVRSLDVPGGHPECIALSPGGDRLAAGTYDGTVEIWDMPPEKAARSVKAGGQVSSLAFTPDGKTLVGSLGAELRAWDVATGEVLRTIVTDLPGAADVAISPDGRAVASGLSDGTARIWSLADGTELHKLDGPGQALYPVAFSPDGTILVAGTGVALGVWDVATGQHLGILGGPLGTGYSLAFSPDGKRLATGSCGAIAGCTSPGIQLWSMPKGDAERALYGLTGAVRGVAFSSKGGELAAVAENVVIWNVKSGRLVRTMSPGGK